jgi:hypothetical protein
MGERSQRQNPGNEWSKLPERLIRQPREPEPSVINEKTITDFTRVVEQTGILGSVSV